MDHITSSPSAHALASGTLVINMKQRPERLTQLHEHFAAVGYTEPWERLPAVAGVDLPGFNHAPWFRGRSRDLAWAGRAGCVMSHRNAIRHARENSWESVLILEDDVRFADDITNVIPVLRSELENSPVDWAACYLGFTSPIAPCRMLSELGGTHSLFQISGCSTTHAYILKMESYDCILAHLPDESEIWPWLAKHRAIDRWYSKHLSARFPVLAVAPGVAGQMSDFSDIGQRGADEQREDEFFAPLPDSLLVHSEPAFQAAAAKRAFRVRMEGYQDTVRAWRKRIRGL